MFSINSEKSIQIQKLIRDCGKIMLSAHDIESVDGNISEKSGDANFVTVYDVKVQETLIKGLSGIVPDAHFLAEEKENNEDDVKSGFCFIIDPIDGTTNFIHDMKCSAISVALLSDGVPVFGAIYSPYTDEMYTAVKGEGAYLNSSRIYVSSRPLCDALISFGTSPYRKHELGDVSFETAKKVYMHCADIRRSGSAAIDIAFVAAGRTDAFFEVILSPWDYAAGYVIVTEAGGYLTAFDGSSVSFGHPSPVLCVSGKLRDELVAIINS